MNGCDTSPIGFLEGLYVDRAFAVGHPIMPSGLVESIAAVLAASFLICWISVLGIFALILFQRQDLARE